MPLVVNKYIYSLVPGQVPFYVRPLVSMVTGLLDAQLCNPALRNHIKLVCYSL